MSKQAARSLRLAALQHIGVAGSPMRTSEQSPKGVNGLRMLLVEIEQLQPCRDQRLASATPRTHVVVLMAAHQ